MILKWLLNNVHLENMKKEAYESTTKVNSCFNYYQSI